MTFPNPDPNNLSLLDRKKIETGAIDSSTTIKQHTVLGVLGQTELLRDTNDEEIIAHTGVARVELRGICTLTPTIDYTITAAGRIVLREPLEAGAVILVEVFPRINSNDISAVLTQHREAVQDIVANLQDHEAGANLAADRAEDAAEAATSAIATSLGYLDLTLDAKEGADLSAANALASEVAAKSSEDSARASAATSSTQATNAGVSASQASGFAAAALSSSSAAAISAAASNDARIATQDMMDTFANYRFLGKVEWWAGNWDMVPDGFLPLNGQLVSRSIYPEMWEDISNGIFPSVSDALWLSGPNTDSKHRNRAKFSTGDGSTTFRLPDLNGAQTDSMKGLFLRGAQNTDGLGAGDVFRDAIRNITASFTTVIANNHSDYAAGAFSGASNLGPSAAIYGSIAPGSGFTDTNRYGYAFDASRVVPTAVENRPVSAVGLWIMLVSGGAARNLNPTTGASLGSNTFSGVQNFAAGFVFSGVQSQLVQTDIDQLLTAAQKAKASQNIEVVNYGQDQSLTMTQKLRAATNIGAVVYDQAQSLTATQSNQARANLDLGFIHKFADGSRILSQDGSKDIRIFDDGKWGGYQTGGWLALGVGQGGTGGKTIAEALTGLGIGTPEAVAARYGLIGVSTNADGQHQRTFLNFRTSNGNGSEIWRLVVGTFVKSASSTDSISVSYGFTFTSRGDSPMINNGDGAVDGNIILSPFGSTSSGFGCAARLGGQGYLGTYRGNYMVFGRVS